MSFTYYIDAVNGDDANDGLSPETAFQHGSAVPTAGQTENGYAVRFRRGQVHTDYANEISSFQTKPQVALLPNNEEERVTIGAYGTGHRPILDGEGTTDYGVLLNNIGRYYTIEDLHVRGVLRGGITAWNTVAAPAGDTRHLSNLIIRRCKVEFDDADTNVIDNANGINVFEGSTTLGFGTQENNDILIEDCEVYRSPKSGVVINLRGRRNVIRRCYAEDCAYRGNGWGLYLGGNTVQNVWTVVASSGGSTTLSYDMSAIEIEFDPGWLSARGTEPSRGDVFQRIDWEFISDPAADLVDFEWTFDPSTKIAYAKTTDARASDFTTTPTVGTNFVIGPNVDCVIEDSVAVYRRATVVHDGVNIGADRGCENAVIRNCLSVGAAVNNYSFNVVKNGTMQNCVSIGAQDRGFSVSSSFGDITVQDCIDKFSPRGFRFQLTYDKGGSPTVGGAYRNTGYGNTQGFVYTEDSSPFPSFFQLDNTLIEGPFTHRVVPTDDGKWSLDTRDFPSLAWIPWHAVKPGDTVDLMGQRYIEQLVIDGLAGTATDRITIQNGTIDGKHERMCSNLKDLQHVDFRNVHFYRGLGKGQWLRGANTDGVRFLDCEASYTKFDDRLDGIFYNPNVPEITPVGNGVGFCIDQKHPFGTSALSSGSVEWIRCAGHHNDKMGFDTQANGGPFSWTDCDAWENGMVTAGGGFYAHPWHFTVSASASNPVNVSGTVYRCDQQSATDNPDLVWDDFTRSFLTYSPGAGSGVAVGEFDYDANYLYINTGASPLDHQVIYRRNPMAPVTWTRCRSWNNRSPDSIHGSGIHVDDMCSNALVVDCEAWDNEGAGFWSWRSSDVEFRFCTARRNGGWGETPGDSSNGTGFYAGKTKNYLAVGCLAEDNVEGNFGVGWNDLNGYHRILRCKSIGSLFAFRRYTGVEQTNLELDYCQFKDWEINPTNYAGDNSGYRTNSISNTDQSFSPFSRTAYVVDSGSNGVATRDNPWVGLANVDWGWFVKGDTLVLDGEFEGQLHNVPAGVIVSGGVIDATGNADSVRLASGSVGARFDGVTVANAERRGFELSSGLGDTVFAGQRVENCAIQNISGSTGGSAETGVWANGAGHVVRNTSMDGVGIDGLWIRGQHSQVLSNFITNVGIDDAGNGDNIQLAFDCSYAVVRNNHCDHSNLSGKQCIIVSDEDSGSDGQALIADNFCWMRTPDDTESCSGIFIRLLNSEVLRNECKEGYLAIVASPGSTGTEIVGNICYDHKQYQVAVNNDVTIAQHTGVNADRGIHTVGNTADGTAVYNAILVGHANRALTGESSQDLDSICTWDIASGVVFGHNGGSSGGPGVTNHLEADPLFVNPDAKNFRLNGDSPCIRAGTRWWTTGSQPNDHNGKRYQVAPQGVDMGAYAVSHDAGYAWSLNALPVGVLEAGVDIAKAVPV